MSIARGRVNINDARIGGNGYDITVTIIGTRGGDETAGIPCQLDIVRRSDSVRRQVTLDLMPRSGGESHAACLNRQLAGSL